MCTGYIEDFEQAYKEIRCTHIYRFARNIYGEKWDDAKFRYLIHDLFGLDLRQKVKLLSAGMKKKFWLAVVLAHSPKLLLLDEPTTSLDPVSRDEILDVISELSRKEGVGVLFSTHITEDLGKIAHRIILLQDGRIPLNEAASEIFGLYYKIDVQNRDPSEINRILEDCGGVLSRGYVVVKKSGEAHGSAEPANLDDIILYERKNRNAD
jgi:ABC-2 type transport system ATP-binding protein